MSDEQLDKLEKLIETSLEEGEYLDLTFDEAMHDIHGTMRTLIASARENAALRRELQKDAPLALKARQWRRAEDAAGEGKTMDELRTLDRIAADYRRELWELAAPDTEAGGV